MGNHQMADPVTTNAFPCLHINTEELVAEVDRLLREAFTLRNDMDFGAVNWGDLGVADVEYRLSMLHPENGPHCIVLVEEASPSCSLPLWLNRYLDPDRFPNTFIECEW